MIVVVKLPNKLNERVLAFPFLHVLEELLQEKAAKNPDDDTFQLHLVSLKDDLDILNLLPFDAFYHQIEKEDLKSIFTAHRACGNLTLPNGVNVAISTTDSFVDASMGKHLGAKTKIGFELGKNGWFLNKKVKHPGSIHKSTEICHLIKPFTGILTEIPNVQARKVDPLYENWQEEPYLVIDLDLIDGEINPEWKELAELCEGKEFTFMCSALGEHFQKDKVLDFIAELPIGNRYKFFHYKSNIEFAKLISYSAGFVTKNSGLMCLSTYCCTSTFFMNPGLDMKLFGPHYFRGELKEYPFKSAKTFSYNLVFDDLISLIDSKTQEES